MQNPFAKVAQRRRFHVAKIDPRPGVDAIGKSFDQMFELLGALYADGWSVDRWQVAAVEDGISFEATRKITAWRAFFDRDEVE